MSEKVDLFGRLTRSRTLWKVAGIGLLIVVVTAVIVQSRKVDDVELAQALTGAWSAVDPNDATIHRRDVPVTHEQLDILADHTLTYTVELASRPGDPDMDRWAWKVRKGRLYVRYSGDDAGGQWLPGIAFSVSYEALSMRMQDRPPKRWVRR